MSLQWTGRRISGIDGRVRASLNDIRGEELLEAEPIAGGVEDPGVVVGALHAGVQPQGLSRQLAGAQRARVGQGAVGLALDVALVLPLAEIPQCSKLSWVLHPLDHLIGMEGMVNLEFWDLATM